MRSFNRSKARITIYIFLRIILVEISPIVLVGWFHPCHEPTSRVVLDEELSSAVMLHQERLVVFLLSTPTEELVTKAVIVQFLW